MITQQQSTASPDVPTSQPTQYNNRPRNGGNRRRGGNQRIAASNPTSYVGECEDIGIVLALRSERFDKKVSFVRFMEKMSNYVISNLKDGGDVQSLFIKYQDPTNAFITANKPVKPDENDPDVDEADVDIYKEDIKQFVQRKINLRRNLEKCYGLVWGQCSGGLQTYLRGTLSYETKSVIFDVVWLIHAVKKATSGIDDRANGRKSMHAALLNLYMMKQGATESNDSFLARFKSNITAVNLTGGDHLFFFRISCW